MGLEPTNSALTVRRLTLRLPHKIIGLCICRPDGRVVKVQNVPKLCYFKLSCIVRIPAHLQKGIKKAGLVLFRQDPLLRLLVNFLLQGTSIWRISIGGDSATLVEELWLGSWTWLSDVAGTRSVRRPKPNHRQPPSKVRRPKSHGKPAAIPGCFEPD